VRKGGALVAPVWPGNPWTGKTMAPGTGKGTYTYTPKADLSCYTLVGHLSSGPYKVTDGIPRWFRNERTAAATAAAKNARAELGPRVLKDHVEQWGTLYRGTQPAA